MSDALPLSYPITSFPNRGSLVSKRGWLTAKRRSEIAKSSHCPMDLLAFNSPKSSRDMPNALRRRHPLSPWRSPHFSATCLQLMTEFPCSRLGSGCCRYGTARAGVFHNRRSQLFAVHCNIHKFALSSENEPSDLLPYATVLIIWPIRAQTMSSSGALNNHFVFESSLSSGNMTCNWYCALNNGNK